MLCCYLSIHKHFCHTTIQEYFDCYIFKHIYLSTLIFNHISFNILNILLIALWLTFFFAMLLGISICVLLCCTFLSMGYATTLQFYHSFFFSVLYSGYTISLFFCSNTFSSIISLLLYFIHYTLVISFLFTSFFSILPSRSHTACFLLVFWKGILALSFCRFELSCFYILYNPYILLLSFLSIIFSQAEVYLLEVCSISYNISMFFSI